MGLDIANTLRKELLYMEVGEVKEKKDLIDFIYGIDAHKDKYISRSFDVFMCNVKKTLSHKIASHGYGKIIRLE